MTSVVVVVVLAVLEEVVVVVVVVVVIYENVMIRLVFRCVAPRHGASSVCGWRILPADMEGSCLYFNKWFADSGWPFSSEGWRGSPIVRNHPTAE
jgi:hypothetical protein